MTSRVPLDSNELDYLYDLWDKDGNQSLTPEELVAGVLSHSKQAKPKGRRSSIKFEMPEDIDEARRAAAVKAVTRNKPKIDGRVLHVWLGNDDKGGSRQISRKNIKNRRKQKNIKKRGKRGRTTRKRKK